MGRAFEFRKGRKMKRWANMSKAFTKYGRQIAMTVKAGGGDPDLNAALRAVIQNAKAANMPKDRIEAAIKRASNKDSENYEEIVYEGYGPFGVAVLVETSTDNSTRTVANVRAAFNKYDGTLGKTGSLDFIFTRKAVFKLKNDNQNIEELEFDLIDYGLENIFLEDDEIVIHTAFTDFGSMQKALEDKKIEVISSDFQRIPNTTVEINDEQAEHITKLIDKLEEDDDVINVFYNIA